MGNCIMPADPLLASFPRGINVDASPITVSQLPIIFMVGGPGAGKRTVCNYVAQKYGFLSIITSDILRNEVSTRTDRAFAVARLMSQGRLIPSDVLVELLAVRMLDNLHNTKGFIVAGFPKNIDQSKLFDREIRSPDLVIMLNVRNSVMNDRVMARIITTTERTSTLDYDIIMGRIKMFRKKVQPIIKHYKHHLLVVVDGEPEITTVFEDVCRAIDNLLEELSARSAVDHTVSVQRT